MVRELFQLARSKKASAIAQSHHRPITATTGHRPRCPLSAQACIVFFDEVDAIGGARFDDGAGGDNEVQRTMLQIVTELDGFDARGNVKVLMATNRSVRRDCVSSDAVHTDPTHWIQLSCVPDV
jgi:ATP-dependent 26S proteasome regulatory subunit